MATTTRRAATQYPPSRSTLVAGGTTTTRRSSAMATNALNSDLNQSLGPRRSLLNETSYNQPLDWNIPPTASWEHLYHVASELKQAKRAILDAVGQDGMKRMVYIGLRPAIMIMERKIEDTAEARFGFVGRFALTCESMEALAVLLPLPSMVFMALIHVLVLRSGFACTGSDTEGEMFDQIDSWPELLPQGWVNDDGTVFTFRYRPKAGAVEKLVLVGKVKDNKMTIAAYDPITFIGSEEMPFLISQYVSNQPGENIRVNRDMEHIALVTLREKVLNMDQWTIKHKPIVRRTIVPKDMRTRTDSPSSATSRLGGGGSSSQLAGGGGKTRLDQLKSQTGGGSNNRISSSPKTASPKTLSSKDLSTVPPVTSPATPPQPSKDGDRGRVNSLRKEQSAARASGSSNGGGGGEMDDGGGGSNGGGRVREGSFLQTPEEFEEETRRMASNTRGTRATQDEEQEEDNDDEDDEDVGLFDEAHDSVAYEEDDVGLLDSVQNVDMQGTLSKRTKAGTWHARVFKLVGVELLWLRSDNKSLHKMGVSGAIVRDIQLGAKKSMFEILPLEGQPLMLSASGEAEKKEWIRAISHAAGTESEVAPHDTTMSKAKVALLVSGLSAAPKLAVPKKQPTKDVVIRPGQIPCMVCGSVVYKMEELLVNGKMMHRSCFTCCECSRVLSLNDFGMIGGTKQTYYCKKHYSEAMSRQVSSTVRNSGSVRKQAAPSGDAARTSMNKTIKRQSGVKQPPPPPQVFTTGATMDNDEDVGASSPPTASSTDGVGVGGGDGTQARKSRRFSFSRLFSSKASSAPNPSSNNGGVTSPPSSARPLSTKNPPPPPRTSEDTLSPALSHHSMARPKINSEKRRPSGIPKSALLLSDAKSLRDLAGTADLAEHPFTFRVAVDGNVNGKEVLWLHASSYIEAQHWQMVLVSAVVALDLRRVLSETPSGPKATQLKEELDSFLSRSETEYEGFLDKLSFRSVTIKNWKRRYVKLNGKGELSYSEDENSKKPKNVMKLSHLTKVMDSNGDVANAPKEI